MSENAGEKNNRPLRIAYIDYALQPDKPGQTGLSDVVWDMASTLVEMGHEPHIVASYTSDTVPDPRVTLHNFKAPPMGYRNIIGNIWLLIRAAKIMRELEPDIIHAPEYLSTAIFATLGIKIPLVLTVPGNIFRRIKHGHSYEWSFVQVLKWAAKVSAKKCAVIIAISKDMKYWWEKTGSIPEKTPWISYGIDIELFHPIQDARKILGIDDADILYLYAGRLAKEKGLFELLHSVSDCSDSLRNNNARTVIFGEGPDARDLETAIHQLDLDDIVDLHTVRLTKQELAKWYSAADAFLLPSFNEPLGRVILESMACGTPVIATACEGPLDHIQNGYNGFLYPVHGIDQLTTLLSQTAADRFMLNNLGYNCVSYIHKELSWQSITKRIVNEVYWPVIHGK